MDKIKLQDKTFKPYLTYDVVQKAIDSVAQKINSDFKNAPDTPVLLCILNGAVMFAGDLMKRLDFPCELASLKVTSYVGTKSNGKVKAVNSINGNVSGRRVIIVEDVVDTGNTIEYLRHFLSDAGATEIRVCTMLFKKEVYKKDIPINYVGMEIPNDFIVGYGLDYNELGRNYKDIYVIDE